MREIIIKWLREATQLNTGEELYIPTDNQTAQKDTYGLFRKELEILRRIEPEESAKIRIYTTYRDGKFWVGLKKVSITPLVAFKKDADGTVSRISITNERETDRIKMLKEKHNGSL